MGNALDGNEADGAGQAVEGIRGGKSRMRYFVRVGRARGFSRRTFGPQHRLHPAFVKCRGAGTARARGEMVVRRSKGARAAFLYEGLAKTRGGCFRQRDSGYEARAASALRSGRRRGN